MERELQDKMDKQKKDLVNEIEDFKNKVSN